MAVFDYEYHVPFGERQLVAAYHTGKLLEEDALFDKYTHALVEQYKADGKDVKPLLLELAKMKAEGR